MVKIITRLSFSAIMANPRKFSEKIALHNQKQAEETAAFEAIMKEVNNATRTVVYAKQHLPISPSLGAYRGGSLPNVNQIGTNQGIDLQTALQHLEDIKQGRPNITDRIHRDRSRPIVPHRSRPFPIDKRVDCSPYGTAYLSPPPDTSWRRTNSDSALHTSAMGPGTSNDYTHPPKTPPTHRRIMEMVGEDSGDIQMKGYWGDPKKLVTSRPKSCEVPNINIYPSQEQDMGPHIPISNNTGSLPDLTVLHFPSPLTTPLDAEDGSSGAYGGNSSPSSLSPTSPHHMAMPPPSSQQSPASRRRPPPGVPSPLVLNNNNQMRVPLSPPVDPSRLQMDPRIAQQYMLHLHQQRQRSPLAPTHHHPHPHLHQHHTHHHHPVMTLTLGKGGTQGGVGVGAGGGGTTHPTQGQVGAPLAGVQPRGLPQVHITACDLSEPQPSMTQYRNSVSDAGCQSPTSPHSAPSYSPAQSPGLPSSAINNSPFAEAYYLQQHQQQTSALQHQFEQFNMDNSPISAIESQLMNNGLMSPTQSMAPPPAINFSQVVMHGLGSSIDFQQQQSTQQQQHQQSQQQQQPPNFFHTDLQLAGLAHLAGLGLSSASHSQHISPSSNNKIPDIVLTGADDPFGRTPLDFAKDLGNAITGMPDGFDADFLSNDEAFKADLGPLDFDGLQMLTDPNMVTDPATEDTFKLDRL
ncbi:CREB-regulated transcription coactivator 1-like isoform X2 [Pomacea canaliculata]|uniref:CREB-regulated transcription coactivator 1-like isoform X2 n=1 Tax=Pomacea canaliculata TaxID=400727 RepID=UPI000D72CD56|nr:CREB-regulated transcription coactivator 1-like isoform X2 [Pomacea canaliculata]